MSRSRTIATALAGVVALVGTTACSSGGDDASPARDLPVELATFLDGVASAGSVPFTATYEVIVKLGGVTSTVVVEASPPAWRITAGDVVVVGGPTEATCRRSTASCRKGIDEAALSGTGVFSGFFADAPVRQVTAAARRPDAVDASYASNTVAGVSVDCVTIESAPVTVCVTPDGVVGLLDDSAKRYALTSYAPSAPSDPLRPPFPVT